MSLKKMAAKDAAKWARAEMFFGEGAGTRRKLLTAEIDQKAYSIPGYLEAFQAAYNKQDMAEHAIKAAKERKHLDSASFINKNAKAIIRGDLSNVSPVVFVALATGVVLHQTGYDKVIWDKSKREYHKARVQIKKFRLEHNL